MQFENLIDSTEASILLDVTPRTLRNMVKRGELHSGRRIGGTWRFDLAEVLDVRQGGTQA